MQEVHDWELNFKMLKARGREAEKLPSEKKVKLFYFIIIKLYNIVLLFCSKMVMKNIYYNRLIVLHCHSFQFD